MVFVRKLKNGLKKTGGRNNKGRITCYHRGGGNKRSYYMVDLKRQLLGIPGKVLEVRKDANRRGHIALVGYVNGIFGYILAPEGLQVGTFIVAGKGFEDVPFISKLGSSKSLVEYAAGEMVYNVGMRGLLTTTYARSPGSCLIVIRSGVLGNKCLVKMPSKEIRLLDGTCWASKGVVSNLSWHTVKLGKAGVVRSFGRRPVVRGVAMNPIDHPHGGNTAGGRPSVSPWGRLTKGKPTRAVRKNAGLILVRRNKG